MISSGEVCPKIGNFMIFYFKELKPVILTLQLHKK